MIKIWSEWHQDNRPNGQAIMTIFMSKNNETANFAFDATNCLEDSDQFLDFLNAGLQELINLSWPERANRLWRLKQELKVIEKRKESILHQITENEGKDKK